MTEIKRYIAPLDIEGTFKFKSDDRGIYDIEYVLSNGRKVGSCGGGADYDRIHELQRLLLNLYEELKPDESEDLED